MATITPWSEPLAGSRLARHGLGGQPLDVEGADQIHGHDPGEDIERHRSVAPEGTSAAPDPGAAHGNVEPSTEFLRRGDGAPDVVLGGDVAGGEPCPVAQARRNLVAALGEVEHHDARAPPDEVLGCRGTQAGRATRDQGGAVPQLHRPPLALPLPECHLGDERPVQVVAALDDL